MHLSIDPSIASLGWAVFDGCKPVSHGTWHPSKKPNARDRFDQLAEFIRDLLAVHEHVSDVVVEVPSGGLYRMGSTAMIYGRAIGVCECAAALSGATVHRIPVNTWKGNARKSKTQAIVKYGLKIDGATEDQADALGLGLWFGERKRLQERTAG